MFRTLNETHHGVDFLFACSLNVLEHHLKLSCYVRNHNCLIHPRCFGLTGFVLTVFFSSPVTFTITSALSSKFFIYFFLNTKFPSCTDHPHMTSNPVSGILSKRPLMSFTVMVATRVVCTTRDLHTDAHLELVLVLVLDLVLFLQLTMFLCFLLHVLIPAVGYALFFFCTCSFIRRRSALFYLDLLTSRRYWLMLLWTPRLTRLSGPVSGLPLPASPLASADSHYLCNVRPWLRQGLGCSRADPRGILSLSACSPTCCVFARVEEDLSPPLQTPCGSRAQLATSPSAWSWFRRATCGPLLYVAGQASKVCTETSFCTSLWAWLPAIVHSSALNRRVTALASRVALPPKLSRV